MESNGKIKIPDFRDYVPLTDSVLRQKISISKNWAKIYIYICNITQDNKYQVSTKEIASIYKIDSSYVLRLLNGFSDLGYLRKIRRSHKNIFVITDVNMLIKQNLIDIAKDCLER